MGERKWVVGGRKWKCVGCVEEERKEMVGMEVRCGGRVLFEVGMKKGNVEMCCGRGREWKYGKWEMWWLLERKRKCECCWK